MSNAGKSLKEAAKDFLHLAASGKVQQAYDLYVAPDFTHHNPYFKGDRQSLLEAMEQSAATQPDNIFEVKHCLQDGEMVTTYSHIRQNADDPGYAVFHMFRFRENQIAELWDVAIPVPKEQINENGLF